MAKHKPYRYSMDIFGTVDDNPETAHLARALAREGHDVYFITASDLPDKALKAKLYALNIVKYQKPIIRVTGKDKEAEGRAKGLEINKLGISIHWDNDVEVLRGIAATSRVTRHYVLNNYTMQPKTAPAREVCRCELEVREFKPMRCMHCEYFYETAAQRREHSRLHHG